MLDLELPSSIKCYDGCYDSATQRVLDEQEAALKRIRSAHPEAWVTFHPADELWVVHVWGRPLSDYQPTKGSALADALRRLQ